MFAWAMFAVVVIGLAISIVSALVLRFVGSEPIPPNTLNQRDSRWQEYHDTMSEYRIKERRLSDKYAAIVFPIAAIIIFGTPFVVEFPSLIKEPTAATFNRGGELVYHKWGLFTPPWSDREVVNVPRRCTSVNLEKQYVSVLFEANEKIYVAWFSARMCLTDPQKFYRLPERREQKASRSAYVALKRNALWDLYHFYATRGHELVPLLTQCTPKEGDAFYRVSACNNLSGYIERAVNDGRYREEGLEIRSSGEIWEVTLPKGLGL